MSDDQFNPAFMNVYPIRIDSPDNIAVKAILGDTKNPMLLSLALPTHPHPMLALATPPLGAILEIRLDLDSTLAMIEQLCRVARTLGWRLPKEGA